MNTTNPKGAGRKTLPAARKKVKCIIFLIPSEIEALEAKYGSLTLAIRSVIIQDKPEILPILDKIIDLSAELKALMS